MSVTWHEVRFQRDPAAIGKLWAPTPGNQQVRWSRPAGWTRPAGERQIRLEHTFPATGQSRECVVNVAGVLLFHSA